MRSLPNAISTLRALSFVAVVALLAPETAVIALVVFSLAALTDAVDGPLARRLGATSALGAFLDPLADKILVLGTLGGLLARGGVDALPVALILAREIGVTGVRTVAARRGIVIGSNVYGKAKAVLQGAAVFGQILVLAWPVAALAPLADVVLWAAALATVLTGVDVARRAVSAIGRPTAGAVRAHAR